MNENPWMIPLSFFLGHLLSVTAACLILITASFVISAEKTSGTVVQAYRLPNHRITHLTIEFPVNDEKIRFSQPINFYSTRLGQSIPVLYSRGDPKNARIGLFWSLWNGAIVCSFLALLCYAVASSARQNNEPVKFPSAGFLIFNDIRARVIAYIIVAAIVFWWSCSH
jgi:hypothetical protein